MINKTKNSANIYDYKSAAIRVKDYNYKGLYITNNYRHLVKHLYKEAIRIGYKLDYMKLDALNINKDSLYYVECIEDESITSTNDLLELYGITRYYTDLNYSYNDFLKEKASILN